MRFNVLRAVCVLAIALSMTACESPTQADPRIPPAVGTPARLMIQPCEYGTATAQCPLEAIWGDLYRSSRMVTTEAQWTSSAPGVVRVGAPGTLQAVGPGDADVTMRYNDRELVATFRVFESGPPWYVLKGTSVEYHVQVRDDRDQRLEGVLVEIMAGGNAGQSAVSDSNGTAIFRGESACGPITVRGTKEGYQPWVGSATKCGRAGNGNWGSETVGPVVMRPL